MKRKCRNVQYFVYSFLRYSWLILFFEAVHTVVTHDFPLWGLYLIFKSFFPLLTWAKASKCLDCSACTAVCSPSSGYCDKHGHFRILPWQNSPPKTNAMKSELLARWLTDKMNRRFYLNGFFVRLRRVQNWHQRREAALCLLSLGSNYMCGHLDGNASHLILNVVLHNIKKKKVSSYVSLTKEETWHVEKHGKANCKIEQIIATALWKYSRNLSASMGMLVHSSRGAFVRSKVTV